YHDAILDAIPDSPDSWDGYQLLYFAVNFALQGDEEARRALYDKFDRQEFREPFMGASQIIDLDGFDGMLHVAEVLGARILSEPDFRENDDLLWELYEEHGKDVVMAKLKAAAESNENVRAYFDEISKRAEESAAEPKGPSVLQIDEVL